MEKEGGSTTTFQSTSPVPLRVSFVVDLCVLLRFPWQSPRSPAPMHAMATLKMPYATIHRAVSATAYYDAAGCDHRCLLGQHDVIAAATFWGGHELKETTALIHV